MTKFDYFVVLADMRTGSNFLESNLNTLDGVTCFGEAFNPAFVGSPKNSLPFEISLQDRENDPQRLIDAIKQYEGLNGFRFFHDHDPRVLDICLADPRCAKIILNRNALDSYISLKIARATGQWKLTNESRAKKHRVDFDAREFNEHHHARREFQSLILRRLQVTGQTGFFIGYDDLHDIDVLNGLAAFLDIRARLTNLDKKLKKQNPEPVAEKVSNLAQMQQALRDLDPFDLARMPNFEPRKGPAIPTFVAAAKSGLIHMPLRSGPEEDISSWFESLDKAAPLTGFSQSSLRQWHRDHVPFRRFTVLRHPVARAHAAFCDRILTRGPGSFPQLRESLCKIHKLPIPPDLTSPADYDDSAHAEAFFAFLNFLRKNLGAQTGIRVDAAWASQLTLLQGMAQFILPEVILREENLPEDLPRLAREIGLSDVPAFSMTRHKYADRLEAIYDPIVEAAARDAYTRDYESFGFSSWR